MEVNYARVFHCFRDLLDPQRAEGDPRSTGAQAPCASDAPTPALSRRDVEIPRVTQPAPSAKAGRAGFDFY